MSRPLHDLSKFLLCGAFFLLLGYRLFSSRNLVESIDAPPPEPFVYEAPILPQFANLTGPEQATLSDYAIGHLYQNITNENFMEQAHRARLMNGLWKGDRDSEVFNFLAKQLYSWLPISLESLSASWTKPRGIVMTTGSGYLRFAVHAIQTIRHLSCSLPIEIFYSGEADLVPSERDLLASYPGVTCVDLSANLNITALKLETWDVKPFALLLSSFQEAILMDADAVFLQSPERLFAEPLYQQTGSLFFRDRTLFGGSWDKPRWLLELLPPPLSPTVLTSRFFQAQSLYEQEAGVVVLDKKSHFIGLLTTCRLNLPGAKEVIHWHTYGEKETFWLGLAMAGEAYGLNPQTAGAVGVPVASANDPSQLEICGHLAHFDSQGRLLWFNDGIVQDKRQEGQDLVPGAFTHWAQEGSWSPFMCAIGNVTELTAGERLLLEQLVGLYQPHPTKYSQPGQTLSNEK